MPDTIITRYSTNFIVQTQHADNTLILNFFEVHPPLIIASTPEEFTAHLADQGGVIDAECVARIAVPAARAVELIQLLMTQVRSITAREEKEAEHDTDADDTDRL